MGMPAKSLTFKISFFVILAMVASFVIFSLVFVLSERRELLNDLVKNGETFANFSTRTIYDNYVQYYTHPRPEDFSKFRNTVQEVLSNNTDVVKISLIGINGRILFDSEEFSSGKYTGNDRMIEDKKTLEMIKEDKTVYRNISDQEEELTEIIVPIYQAEGHIFSMRYLLSHQSFFDRLKEVYIQIVLVIIPLIILVIIIAVPVTAKLIKPIKALTSAAEKIRQGDFETKIDIKSQDEMGQLAVSFNEMADKLKKTYGVLETKVKERTAELEAERKNLGKKVKERTTELEKLKVGLEQTVAERTKVLEEKLVELERMNKYMVGRELRMAELKREINEFKEKPEETKEIKEVKETKTLGKKNG